MGAEAEGDTTHTSSQAQAPPQPTNSAPRPAQPPAQHSPLSTSSATQSGDASSSARLSLISSTAWGKRVISVRWMGRLGSRYHLRYSGSTARGKLCECNVAGTLSNAPQQPSAAAATAAEAVQRWRRFGHSWWVRECESAGVQMGAGVGACLPALAVVGPSSGFSFIMHRLVSRLQYSGQYTWGSTCKSTGQKLQEGCSAVAGRGSGSQNPAGTTRQLQPNKACTCTAALVLLAHLMRTVGSKGIWKAVRWYCVRIMGLSCLESTTRCTSVKRVEVAAMASSAALPCRQTGVRARGEEDQGVRGRGVLGSRGHRQNQGAGWGQNCRQGTMAGL
jgi:hypothetical protein